MASDRLAKRTPPDNTFNQILELGLSVTRTLAIDGLRLTPPRTAMGRYLEVMLGRWGRAETPFDQIVVFCRRRADLNGLDFTGNVRAEVLAAGLHAALWQQFALPAAAKKFSLLFSPSYACPILHPGPVVLASHGIYENIPDEFGRLARLRATPVNRLSARRADRVIANSKATRTDLVSTFGVDGGKIDVVYPAAADIFFERHNAADVSAEVRKVFGHEAPYLIFVGKLSKRRNVPNLIDAFARVRAAERLPHNLLVVGSGSDGPRVKDLARRAGVSESVRYLPHLNHSILARLYAGADLFVLPTLQEGISWTTFEAMASGTAVLTVEHRSLAEGAGDTAFSVASPSVTDLAEGMRAMLTDESLRRRYAERGLQRVREFSWDRAAARTMEILNKAARPADL